ncbi:MAG: PEP/pyruvate-binding domain-containing protein [Holophagae bacterium]
MLDKRRAWLQEGWVIANHILVSFHVAFISSVLALPAQEIFKTEVLRFIFTSWETLVSAAFMGISFHLGVALHELGHFLTAARLNALNEEAAAEVAPKLEQGFLGRALFLAGMVIRIPLGTAPGVKREGLNYYPDAPYNLAVAAAGPRASRNVAMVALPIAAALLAVGLMGDVTGAIYAGRLLLGIGVVAFLDFRFADAGKYREFRERERLAREKASAVGEVTGWLATCPKIKDRMATERVQNATHPQLGPVTAPWQFRNCGMGGRHTEKEYPESNVSMQEAMFLILSARDYQDAQELTVRLQNRLKEIIEKEEGCRVMGIGLEGGLAPYIDKGDFPLPEVRLWSMMKQAIAECGCRPGVDVAIALDPAMSELEIAYRKEFDMPDSVGMYLCWRDKAKVVLDRDAVLEIYASAIEQYDIPLLSIEDGFSEDDAEGWQLALERLGDSLFIIGDDLVTTNDRTIEEAAGEGLINSALIKANQIGSLYETLLAMLVALGKGMDLVVSHRSKSPNDDMEAQIALSVNSLGLKAGGGANTERLVKYQAVTELMLKVAEAGGNRALRSGEQAIVSTIRAYEEPTNAGIPTVGVTLELTIPTSGVLLGFKGATPLGTSAGTGEAIHLVDSVVEQAEHRETIARYPGLFAEIEPGVYSFAKGTTESEVAAAQDEALTTLFERAERYGGKGCLNAVDNIFQIIAPRFEGVDLSQLGLKEIDSALLGLELATARRRGKLPKESDPSADVVVMQRKQNLGMNALLSASLALVRAAAHVQGKELYELLREEMLEIIDDLAAEFGVAVSGSSFEEYVVALRTVNQMLEEQGRPLYEVLRERTGIYTDTEQTVLERPQVRTEPTRLTPPEAAIGDAAMTEPAPLMPSPPTAARGIETSLPEAFSAADREAVSALNRDLLRAYVDQESRIDIKKMLSSYQQMRADLGQRVGRFGIVNNRLFKKDNRLRIPYLMSNTLLMYDIGGDGDEQVTARRFPNGTIFTINLFDELLGEVGTPIDLEQMLFAFDLDRVVEPRIARIRDIAALLKEVNESSNSNEALHLLRHLVARLCNLSVKAFLGAKNLQPEVNNLNNELFRFINGWLCEGVPGLTRTVVRNLSSVIGKPNLIDQLWNDTIRLAEVEIRGSAIVNELRRSSHHALGKRTLDLAEAYHDFLQNGETDALARLGFAAPAPADIEAATRDKPRRIVARVVEDLGRLLGTSETVARIEEWQDLYAEELLRCPFGNSVEEQLETLVTKGIEARNRWVYSHHLRILIQMADDFTQPEAVVAAFRNRLEALQKLRPDDDGFDTETTEMLARKAVISFVDGLREHYQDELFTLVKSVLEANEDGSPFQTFLEVRELRLRLEGMIRAGGFTAQRYYLQQLDCLLEEINYLALRRIATSYSERGVDLDQCLEIIRISILNLELDGLASREMFDLAGLLSNRQRTTPELLDVLRYVSRHYHKIRQRVTVPYERMSHHLKLDEEDLRTILANMQRYMHDLNSVVHFSDIAGAFIREQQRAGDPPPDDRAPAPDSGAGMTHEFIHISHRDQVASAMAACGDEPNLRERYGGKGSSLLYVQHLDLPTRDGFILPTSIPRAGLHRSDPQWLESELKRHLQTLEEDIAQQTGVRKRFGDAGRPLVLAVRGGSVFSMPGMLTTVVFAGMNDRIAEALAQDGPWRAYDSYRRFLASYGLAVWGVDLENHNLVDNAKRRYGVAYKTDLPWEAMREVAEASKEVFRDHGFADQLETALADPIHQLVNSVTAVFDSWDMARARRYREIKEISHSWQTAVIVQEMAFGNGRNEDIEPDMDETAVSLTGVIPRTTVNDFGIRELSGEFKFSAAGDDLVGGVTSSESFRTIEEFDSLTPMLGRYLRHVASRLRSFMGTDQEVEFTVESGILSVLQSRTAETYADEAIDRFHDPGEPATRGLGVRGGGFRGVVAFDEEDRKSLATTDFVARSDVDGVLMVLENPTPEEIPLIISADGLLTAKGGSTSHAAVAANGIEDKSFCAVMSAAGLQVDLAKREASVVDTDGTVRHRIRAGDIVSIHGTSGEVYVGTRSLIKNGT